MTKRRLKVDLAIVGAGSGGLSVAAGAAQLGLKVVLFEKGEMGGDCLNTGCVPSKALIAAADAAHAVRQAGALGVRTQAPDIEFPAVMDRVRSVIAAIAPHDSQERFEGLGVTVVREAARFADPRTLESDSVRVTARKIVIATGSRPAVPPIPGLDAAPHHTNETIFDLPALPKRLAVLGAGPIGLELGQAFARLGSQVTVIEALEPLAREDRDVAAPVIAQLAEDGVKLLAGSRATAVAAAPGGVVISLDGGGAVEADALLVAVGRSPDLAGLNLEGAGVAYDKAGVTTDRSLRSVSNRRVFAVGDAAGRGAFTHLAGAQASLFVRKALFAQSVDADRLVVPRVTYTDPELAVVGMTETEARERFGDRVRVVVEPFSGNDRARAEGDVRGLAKLVTDKGGRILGAAIVGRGAGDLIQPMVLAMTSKLKLTALTSMIAPYPTRGEINKRVAGQWYVPLLFSGRTRALVSLLKRLG